MSRIDGMSIARATSRRVAFGTIGAAALAAGGYPGAALAVDGVLQNPDTGHWYRYVDASPATDWSTCKAAAESAGGYLAGVDSSAENDWIQQNLVAAAGKPSCWLGASDAALEGNWSWTDGSAVGFTNWAPGEPNDTDGSQNYLAMATDGTWTDETAGQTLSGFVVEWNTDPNAPPETTVPTPPSNLVASYAAGTGVVLSWNDRSSDEAGFHVERMPAGFAFSLRKSTDADVATWTDYVLVPSQTYTYRVAAFNSAGVSAYSNEVSVTTSAAEPEPAPPAAPSELAAVATAARSVQLSWRDNSEDEIRFSLERAEGGSAFQRKAELAPDAAALEDTAVHPGWPYTYRLRALGLKGPSGYSNSVTVTVPATLGVSMRSGTLAHVAKAGRDTVKVGAAFAVADPAGGALDPVARGLRLQVGPVGAPLPVSIDANDPGWKVKSKKGVPVAASWKSPKGRPQKIAVSLDLVRGTISVTASGADFSADRAADVRLLVACGAECGADTATWTQGRPGVLQLK